MSYRRSNTGKYFCWTRLEDYLCVVAKAMAAFE